MQSNAFGQDLPDPKEISSRSFGDGFPLIGNQPAGSSSSQLGDGSVRTCKSEAARNRLRWNLPGLSEEEEEESTTTFGAKQDESGREREEVKWQACCWLDLGSFHIIKSPIKYYNTTLSIEYNKIASLASLTSTSNPASTWNSG